MKKIVFTSGLPRSGSTLLSTLLNQNPNFSSEITNPVGLAFNGIIRAFNDVGSNRSLIDNNKMDNILRNVIENFHDNPGKTVYFNHDRMWTSKCDLLERLYPNYKMIVTVRDIGWILDSFELLHRKNLYNIPIYMNNNDSNYHHIYGRCHGYFDGMIRSSYDSIKDLIYRNINNCLIVEYDMLVSNPEIIMKEIYNHIEEPYFNHHFDNINSNDYEKFDLDINMPGIHKIKNKVCLTERKTVIPPDIWEKYRGLEVWKKIKS